MAFRVQPARRLPRLAAAAVLSIVAMIASGCATASLATSTGPRTDGQWSVAARQVAQVGETVHFDVVLLDPWRPFQKTPISPIGMADYAVLRFADVRIEADFDDRGHFPFTYRFDGVARGTTLRITADVYQQYGRRDYMRVLDQWVRSESPSEVEDRRVASDVVHLEFTQPVFEFRLAAASRAWRFETARIDIRVTDGVTRTVLPHAGGRLNVNGPDAAGAVVLSYEPAADEANAIGTTTATLTIEDAAGHVHRVEATAQTP